MSGIRGEKGHTWRFICGPCFRRKATGMRRKYHNPSDWCILFIFLRTAAQAESRKSSLAKQASAKSSKSRSARSEKSLATSGQLSPTPFMSGSKLVQMKNPLNGVLDDYKDRTDIVRVIGRTLTLVGIRNLVYYHTKKSQEKTNIMRVWNSTTNFSVSV